MWCADEQASKEVDQFMGEVDDMTSSLGQEVDDMLNVPGASPPMSPPPPPPPLPLALA